MHKLHQDISKCVLSRSGTAQHAVSSALWKCMFGRERLIFIDHTDGTLNVTLTFPLWFCRRTSAPWPRPGWGTRCAPPTPSTDSSPSPSSRLASSPWVIRPVTPTVQLRNACRGWNVYLQLWIIERSPSVRSHWSLVQACSGGWWIYNSISTHVSISCNVFPMELLLDIFIQIIFMYLFIDIYWNQLVLCIVYLYGLCMDNKQHDFHHHKCAVVPKWHHCVVCFFMVMFPSTEHDHENATFPRIHFQKTSSRHSEIRRKLCFPKSFLPLYRRGTTSCLLPPPQCVYYTSFVPGVAVM